MKFNIQDYLRNNTINLGTIEKEVGTTPYKGGHNDIRKTNYDVKLTEDGKLDLYTHTKVESTHQWRLNESSDCGCSKPSTSLKEISYNSQGKLIPVKVYNSQDDYIKNAKIGDYIWFGTNISDAADINKSYLSKVVGFNEYGPILIPFGRKKKFQLSNQPRKVLVYEHKQVLSESKNCPTDSSKWSYWKSQAKKKFDVYPSAYANGWAAKQYKAAGGKWKVCKED